MRNASHGLRGFARTNASGSFRAPPALTTAAAAAGAVTLLAECRLWLRPHGFSLRARLGSHNDVSWPYRLLDVLYGGSKVLQFSLID